MRTRSLGLPSYEAVGQVVDEVGEMSGAVAVAMVVVYPLHALDLAWVIVYHMHVVTRLNLESCSSKKDAMMENATVVLLRSSTVD